MVNVLRFFSVFQSFLRVFKGLGISDQGSRFFSVFLQFLVFFYCFLGIKVFQGLGFRFFLSFFILRFQVILRIFQGLVLRVQGLWFFMVFQRYFRFFLWLSVYQRFFSVFIIFYMLMFFDGFYGFFSVFNSLGFRDYCVWFSVLQGFGVYRLGFQRVFRCFRVFQSLKINLRTRVQFLGFFRDSREQRVESAQLIADRRQQRAERGMGKTDSGQRTEES